MNIHTEREYLNKMSRDLANEIDFDILSDILSAQGWTPVEFLPFTYSKQAKDIADWTEQHSMGKWRHCGVKFVFERAADATAAILKWQ
jgi:hypothetical protein